MANNARVTIEGNLTRDPELRFTQAGKGVANFGVACTDRRRGADGQWEDTDAEFFDVSAWERLGDNVADSLRKGDRVIVVGRLKQRSYKTNDGDKRSKVEIVADVVGPSLRWAVAQPTKDNRNSSEQRAHIEGQQAERAKPVDEAPWAGDEEPF